jgi:hypothetical protein
VDSRLDFRLEDPKRVWRLEVGWNSQNTIDDHRDTQNRIDGYLVRFRRGRPVLFLDSCVPIRFRRGLPSACQTGRYHTTEPGRCVERTMAGSSLSLAKCLPAAVAQNLVLVRLG